MANRADSVACRLHFEDLESRVTNECDLARASPREADNLGGTAAASLSELDALQSASIANVVAEFDRARASLDGDDANVGRELDGDDRAAILQTQARHSILFEWTVHIDSAGAVRAYGEHLQVDLVVEDVDRTVDRLESDCLGR